MNCPICGNEIKDPGKFCPFCGAPVTQETTVSPNVSNETATSEGVGKSYQFNRWKGFSYINYKWINTVIDLVDDTLVIKSRTTWMGFIKRPVKVVRIPISQIQTISRHRTVGIYDLIFAIVFLLVSFSSGWFWLLLAALFMWSALAVKYTIECEGHDNYSFTDDWNGSDPQIDDLFQTITKMKTAAAAQGVTCGTWLNQ